MKRTPTQSELPLKRVRAQPIEDTDVVTLRVRTEVADFVNADPAGASQALSDGVRELSLDVEGLIGYTPWGSNQPPPCTGIWELKVRSFSEKAAVEPFRLSYNKDTNAWKVDEQWVPSSVVLADFCWRGLAAPWPHGYTYRVPGQRMVRVTEE